MRFKVPLAIKIIAVEGKRMYNLGEGLTEEMKKTGSAIIERVREVLEISLIL